MNDTLILKNVAVFDGTGGELLRNKTLYLSNGKIEAIREAGGESVGGDARIVDLAGCVASPGFIDCHMHLVLEEVPEKDFKLTTSTPGGERLPNADASTAYLGAFNAKRMLDAGFTTVLDGGGSSFVECALREAINLGMIEGPNYYISCKQLTTNHAHFVNFSLEPYGPWGMRKAVRDLMYWGVDFLKLQLNPPIRMQGRNPNACDFTVEEIAAAVEEAHNYGLPVHAHLRGAEATKRFLKAGGDVVIHGTNIDDEGIELLVKSGRYLFPTLTSPSPDIPRHLIEAKSRGVIDLLRITAEQHWRGIEKAYKAGVRIALSTDSGTLGNRVGENAREFLNMKAIGMSNLEALRAGTSVAAHAIGRDDASGRIAPGYNADIAVLADNPLEDLTATQRIVMTIKGGRIVSDKRPAGKRDCTVSAQKVG